MRHFRWYLFTTFMTSKKKGVCEWADDRNETCSLDNYRSTVKTSVRYDE